MKMRISFILIFLFSIVFSFQNYAAIYQTAQNGKWTTASTWTLSKPSISYGFSDTIILNHQIELDLHLTLYGVIIINSGAELSKSTKDFKLGDGSELINNGSLICRNFTADWGSNSFVNNGLIDASQKVKLYEGIFLNNGTINCGTDFYNDYDSYLTNSIIGSINVGDDFINHEEFTNAGILDVIDDLLNDWSCVINNSGTISNGGDLTTKGTFSTSGILVVGEDFINDWSSSFSNTGSITVIEDIESRGTLTNSGSGNISAGEDFINKGSITNSSTITIVGDYENDWSTTLNNSGNLSVGEDFTNKGNTSNSGTLIIDFDATNKGTITNTNYLSIGENLTNNSGYQIINYGTMSVVYNVVNNGGIENNGSMEVDGSYIGSGTVSGVGDLCHSDGTTDPTGGAKAVTCNICGEDASTLPVELISFEAYINNNSVIINWTTASEVNNHYFEVLRSTDGVNFDLVKTVQGMGNSNVLLDYSIEDLYAGSGIIYYQLKQVDFDGTTTLSKIIYVNKEKSINISIYPNPVSLNDNFTINTGIELEKQILIMDVSGKIIQSFYDNSSIIQVNTSDFSPGIYFIRIINIDQNSITKKIVIQ